MTTVVGGHFMATAPLPPRCGILLNASAHNSPKQVHDLAPHVLPAGASTAHQISSHSSASSSTSSTDDIVSSTSATSAAGTQASTSPATKNQSSSRKIRFAPLPEPRRDYEYDEDPSSPGPFTGLDSATSSPAQSFLALLSPPISPNVRPDAQLRSPNLNGSHAQTSCSTLGLSLDGVELHDSGQATETNTVASSDCGTDDTHTLSKDKKKQKWSRLLPLPNPSTSKQGPRTPDEHGHNYLWRSPSRESTASVYSLRSIGLGSLFGSMSDNGSSASLGRKTHTGADSVPVSSTVSLRGGHSLKPVLSEVGTAAAPPLRPRGHASTASSPSNMRTRRLLNGRIYGRRAANYNKNPFATVLDSQDEFVEWGHGGMGSVRASGAGGSRWAKVQSDKKLSVGHDDGTVASDEDDGSGMTWVKKRREARERKEREEREAKEKLEEEKANHEGEGQEILQGVAEEVSMEAGELKRTSSVMSKTDSEAVSKESKGCDTLTNASDPKKLRDTQTANEKESEEGKAEEGKAEAKDDQDRKEKEHVYTAVTVPAPRPCRQHSQTRQSSLTLNSSLPTPLHSTTHTPTALSPTSEIVPHIFVTGSPLGTPGASSAAQGPSPLGYSIVGAGGSSPSSSSYEDESPLGEKDEDRYDVSDDDEEEEEDANAISTEQARKTAIGAGVEKVSRHKE